MTDRIRDFLRARRDMGQDEGPVMVLDLDVVQAVYDAAPNAIVVVDEYRLMRGKGLPPLDAINRALKHLFAPLLAIGGIIFAVQTNAGLSWLIAVAVPVLLVIAGFIISRMVPLFRQYQNKLDGVNRVMREQLTGVRVVRAFVRERIEEARFRVANTDIMIVGRKVGSLFVIMFPLAMLVLNVTVVRVIWFGGIQVDAGTVQIGTLFAFMQYVGQILMGVLMATFMTIMIPRAAVSADRIGEVLDSSDALVRPENPVGSFPTPGTVEFDDVSFTYPGAEAPVLQGISFRADAGETVAVVGCGVSGMAAALALARATRLTRVAGRSPIRWRSSASRRAIGQRIASAAASASQIGRSRSEMQSCRSR